MAMRRLPPGKTYVRTQRPPGGRGWNQQLVIDRGSAPRPETEVLEGLSWCSPRASCCCIPDRAAFVTRLRRSLISSVEGSRLHTVHAIRRRDFISLLGAAPLGSPYVARADRTLDRILYFTHSAGYRHDVLPLSGSILRDLGENSGSFQITATEDISALTAENLRRFAAIMFYTTGELPVNDGQKTALLDFVRSGGGFLGVHSATDTFYLWPDYLKLIGGYFNGHPWHQAVRITIVDPSDPLVGFLGASWQIADEIYQISDFDYEGSHVLLRLDETSVDLGQTGVRRRFYGWPLAWTRAYGNGRVFYTALGHDEAVWRDPRYQRLLVNAMLWSIRKAP
jgi:uncharacterized protein